MFVSFDLLNIYREHTWLTSGYITNGRVYWEGATGEVANPSGNEYWLNNRRPLSSANNRIAYTYRGNVDKIRYVLFKVS